MHNIAVVIPCYNSSRTIESCVSSIYNQTVLPVEIIAVDDGSSDNTLTILQNLKEQKPKAIEFHIISQKNSGPSSARNLGIKHASSDWIAFLDSDDKWEFDKIQRQLEIIKTDDSIVLCGTLYGSGQSINNHHITEISFKKLLFKNFFNTPTVLIKKSILNKVKFDENQKYSEDYKLWLNVCYKNKCVLLNAQLASNIDSKKVYGSSGLSSNLWEMQKGEFLNFFELYQDKKISLLLFLGVSVFSIIKFIKRLAF